MILLDRSRWAAHFRCPRARFLAYQFAGTGIRLPQAAMPLATGSALHHPIECMLGMLRAGTYPTEQDVRGIVKQAHDAYRESVKDGFQDGVQAHEVQYVVSEQCALIEGSTWAFYLEVFPWMRDEFEILEIEQEHDFAARCTCGLGVGVGTLSDHRARECKGVLLMLRPDFVTKRRSDGSVGAWDIKSSGYDLDRKQHEHSVQLALNCMGVEKDLGQPVQHYYLLGVLKGKREFQNRKERTGLKHQQSPFCYGWMKPGDPSFHIKAEWSPEYTSRKGFSKVPIWEAYFPEKPEGISNVEWWTREYLPKEKRKAQFDILGPCQRPQQLEEAWLGSASALELETQGRLALLDEVSALGEEAWEQALDENFPQSWNCFPYGGGGGGCQFLRVCRKEIGWQELLTSGVYVRRDPHHQQEVDEA